MVQINFGRKEINCKIVYYGPGLSGKTTNLEKVHEIAPDSSKGELTSISTDGDRTLFFDFMPLDLGNIAGMQTKFHIYTVPGQVYYNSTRKLVLLGADGIIFVADSSPGAMEGNKQSLENLKENLLEMGKDIVKVPLVIQFNKRDVKDAMDVKTMESELNQLNLPSFEAVANTGDGVVQTLKAMSSLVLESINSNERSSGGVTAGPVTPPMAVGDQKAPEPVQEPIPQQAVSQQAEPVAAADPAETGGSAADFTIERNHVPIPEPVAQQPAEENVQGAVAVAQQTDMASGETVEPAEPAGFMPEPNPAPAATNTATLPKKPNVSQAVAPPKDESATARRATQQEKVDSLLRKEKDQTRSGPRKQQKLPPRDIRIIGGKPGSSGKKKTNTAAMAMITIGTVAVLAAAAVAYLYFF